MQNDNQRRSATSKYAIIGDSQIPTTLGQTVTGALANIPFPFGIDSDGNYGYRKDGADTVTPFKSGDGEIILYGATCGTYWSASDPRSAFNYMALQYDPDYCVLPSDGKFKVSQPLTLKILLFNIGGGSTLFLYKNNSVVVQNRTDMDLDDSENLIWRRAITNVGYSNVSKSILDMDSDDVLDMSFSANVQGGIAIVIYKM